MRKGRDGENGKKMENGKTKMTSLPVGRPNADQLKRRTLMPKLKKLPTRHEMNSI